MAGDKPAIPECGILGSGHAVRRPSGLKALVLANSLALMGLWVNGAAATT